MRTLNILFFILISLVGYSQTTTWDHNGKVQIKSDGTFYLPSYAGGTINDSFSTVMGITNSGKLVNISVDSLKSNLSTFYTTDGTISDAVRAVTLGSNDINFDENTLFIDGSADRVGIGTTSPNTPLEIVATRVRITDDGGALNTGIAFRDSTSGGIWSIATYQADTGKYDFSIYNDQAGVQGDAIFINGDTKNVGIGTTTPTALLDVNSNIIRLRTAKTPSSATDTGNTGDICWDSTYIYVCIATNTWRRILHATW